MNDDIHSTHDDQHTDGMLAELERDEELDSHRADVMTSVVELRPEEGFSTTKMTDDQLAILAHSDASLHALTRPRNPAPPVEDATAVWETTKMSEENEHLLALANPEVVPDWDGVHANGDDEQLSTVKMSDYEIRRTLEGSKPLEQDRRAMRDHISTPGAKPSSRHAGSQTPTSAASSSSTRSARGTRLTGWGVLAFVAAASLIALLAYGALR